MKNQNVFFALLGSIAVFSLQPANAQPAQAVFIDTFDSPVYVTGAPDTPDLLFVVEQTGKIKIHNLADETTLARPFLDLTTMISGGGERGVLSIAFARDYPTSRLFYVAFTNPTGDVEVDEFRRSADPTRANAATRRKVISIRHRDAGNHNGGQLQFGPDGYLYISIGDGGATPEAAPDLRLLLGAV